MNKVKLGDTEIEIIDGDRGKNYPSKSDFSTKGFCIFLDASNVTKNGFQLENPLYISKEKSDLMRNGKLKKDDIVITTRGTVGNIAHYNENINFENIRINSGMLIIRNSKEFNTKYLYYLLKSDIVAEQIRQKTTGSSQPQITVGILKDLDLLVPSLPTQTAIAHVLSSIDEKIELNNKINKELENLAKMIYEYWFVQNVDKRWERKRIGELLRKYTDNSSHIDAKNIYKIGKYPVVTQDVGDLIKGYTNEENPIIELPAIIFGDHSCTLRYIDFPFFRGADGTQLLYFENKEITTYAFYCIEKIIPFLPNFGKYERHFKYLKDFEINVPTIEILQNFYKIISPIFCTITGNRQENTTLAQLRDFLLPLLMNGQVRVKK